MRTFAPTTRTLVTWALLPLVLLSGMPLAICICASGEQRLFCQRIHAGAQQTAVVETTARSCCHASAAPIDDACDMAISGHCCRSSVELPSPRVTTERLVLPDDNGVTAFLPANMVAPRLPGGDRVSGAYAQGNLPPPDLLVVHCMLLM